MNNVLGLAEKLPAFASFLTVTQKYKIYIFVYFSYYISRKSHMATNLKRRSSIFSPKQ